MLDSFIASDEIAKLESFRDMQLDVFGLLETDLHVRCDFKAVFCDLNCLHSDRCLVIETCK